MARSFLLGLVYAAVFALSVRAFGLTESGNNYVVDTSGGLVFTGMCQTFTSTLGTPSPRTLYLDQIVKLNISAVDKTSGDITSMKFNGIEAQDSSKHSHIASGIGASCSWVR